MFADDLVEAFFGVAQQPTAHPVLIGTSPVWSVTDYSPSELAYFAASPQYLRVFPLSASCVHAWLGMVAPSLIWELTCPGTFFQALDTKTTEPSS